MRSPAPRYPTLRNVQDRRSPGFSTGSSASSRKARALSLTEADKPGVGPLAWPAKRPRGRLRWARFPVPSPIGHGLGLFESNREGNA